MQDQTILETRQLSREFSGFVAVNNVSLKVRQGSIHGLIGPNGAGKTTVFNLLTKFLLPTSGTILYRGEDITGDRPARVARRGLVRSFQISSTFPHMTVLENVRVALQRRLGNSFQFWRSQRSLGQLDERATVRAADYPHQRIPKSRCNRPRSKPTTTSSSTVMTGTAIRPVRAINSARAVASSATFLAVKSRPWDERNSFAA